MCHESQTLCMEEVAGPCMCVSGTTSVYESRTLYMRHILCICVTNYVNHESQTLDMWHKLYEPRITISIYESRTLYMPHRFWYASRTIWITNHRLCFRDMNCMSPESQTLYMRHELYLSWITDSVYVTWTMWVTNRRLCTWRRSFLVFESWPLFM